MHDLQFAKLNRLSCSILKGRMNDPAPLPSIYNPSYAYWKKTWGHFFEQAGSGPDALKLENFTRSEFIIVIHQGEQIAGMLLSTLFHAQALTTYEHSCVSPFPDSALQRLRELPQGRALTGEYLSVNPEFKKSLLGISLADTLIGILMRILRETKTDMALAATVRAAKVADICKAYGYEEVGSYLKIGVDCVMLYNTLEMVREHPSPEVRALVKRLWESRADYSGMLVQNESLRKAA